MDGVDDETWLHHLRRREYSNWFKGQLKDDDLADQAAAIESARDIGAAESRKRFRELITERYTVPA